MFKTTSELRDFIVWAKAERLKSFKAGNIEVTFSDLAFLEAMDEPLPGMQKTEEKNTSKTLVDTLSDKDLEDDELLDWSSRP